MKLKLSNIYVFALILIFVSLSSARAEEQSIALQKIEQTEKCSEQWDALWPLAKEGDLEARAYLSIFLSGVLMHHPVLCAPGGCNDASRFRNTLIMWAHSNNYAFSKNNEGDGISLFYKAVSDFSFDVYNLKSFGGQEFIKCIEQSENNCSKILVDKGVIPSFEEYAKEIDTLANAGFKPKCEGAYKTADGFVEAE